MIHVNSQCCRKTPSSGRLSQKYFQNFSVFPEGLCHGFNELCPCFDRFGVGKSTAGLPSTYSNTLSSSHEEIMIGCEMSK